MQSAGIAVGQLAAPSAAGQHMENLFDVASGKYLRFEAPGVVVRIGMRFAHPEAVQRPAIVEMVFRERARHALDADYRRIGRRVTDCNARYPQDGHRHSPIRYRRQ